MTSSGIARTCQTLTLEQGLLRKWYMQLLSCNLMINISIAGFVLGNGATLFPDILFFNLDMDSVYVVRS